jgi:sulfane dehydrogenase subunit SoxC
LSRVTDETGYLQPTLKQLAEARGPNIGGYHMNPITSWKVKNDGSVWFKLEKYISKRV